MPMTAEPKLNIYTTRPKAFKANQTVFISEPGLTPYRMFQDFKDMATFRQECEEFLDQIEVQVYYPELHNLVKVTGLNKFSYANTIELHKAKPYSHD